jgi:hypothetical protein
LGARGRARGLVDYSSPIEYIVVVGGNMKKTVKKTTFRADSGKLLLDLGKLVFGGVFLGGILRGEVPQLILVIVGFAIAAACCITGLMLVTEEKVGEPPLEK